MQRHVNLFRLTVFRKILMAVTGLIWFGFLIGHLWGNLKLFTGPEHYNAYAEALRELGKPFLGTAQGLWLARLVLIAAFLLHITLATQLTLLSRSARPVRYYRPRRLTLSFTSTTMVWGGIAIGLFIIYHLLHLTFGVVHPDFVAGDVYHNVIRGFQQPAAAIVYMVAMVPLGLHLYHGLWSALQTLGANHPSFNAAKRPLAAVVAIGLAAGNMAIPLSVLLGLVR